MERPRFPLPQPLISGGPDSFVEHSVKIRLPDILASVVDKNPEHFPFGSEERAQIKLFEKELREGTHIIKCLDGSDGGPDWAPYGRVGQNFLTTEWWFLENYSYRLLMSIVQYFTLPEPFDPFSSHKTDALISALPGLGPEHSAISCDKASSFQNAVLCSLWGNQADLSHSSGQVMKSAKAQRLVLDETIRCWKRSLVTRLSSAPGNVEICLVLDNCGAELFNDLLLVDYLLEAFDEARVVLHCKAYPVFVSDALAGDIKMHIEALSDSSSPAYRDSHARVSQRLSTAERNGRLIIEQDVFYTSPTPFFHAPKKIANRLCSFDLVITKGDANFRRLIDDRLFPCNASFQDLMHYWGKTTSLLAVRTCKSPVAVGIPSREIISNDDAAWLTNGTVGIIAFYDSSS